MQTNFISLGRGTFTSSIFVLNRLNHQPRRLSRLRHGRVRWTHGGWRATWMYLVVCNQTRTNKVVCILYILISIYLYILYTYTYIYIYNANTINTNFWSYKSAERAYKLGHHLAGCDPKKVLDHPGSFTKSEWQGQTKEVLRCFQLAMQQCFWVLDIFCRPAAWMRLMMRLDPNVVGSCWIWIMFARFVLELVSSSMIFSGDRTSSGNLQGVCFRAIGGESRGKPLSTDSLTATALPVTPPFFPWKDPIR